MHTFAMTIEVAPEESGDFGYGMIMGIKLMDQLGINQSQTKETVTWGLDVTVPMVPMGYWTDSIIRSLLLETPSAAELPIKVPSKEIAEIFTNADTNLNSTYSLVVDWFCLSHLNEHVLRGGLNTGNECTRLKNKMKIVIVGHVRCVSCQRGKLIND
jgi:hypothetical protein